MVNSLMIQDKIYSKQITRLDLENILQSDASLFPSSLSLQTLQSWYDTNPSHFLNYSIYNDTQNDSSDEISLGISIAFPMKVIFWKKLVSGDLKEHEITNDMILEQNCSKLNEYGMHIWHIKKLELWNQFSLTRFRERFWFDIQYSISILNSNKLKCIGLSSLCVTDEGTRA